MAFLCYLYQEDDLGCSGLVTNCMLWSSEQHPNLCVQGLSQALHVGERHIPARTLHGRHIGPVQFAFQGQALLRPTSLHPLETYPIRQDITQIVWIGQLGRGLRLG